MAKRKICQAMAVVLALGMCTTGLTGCGNEKRADGKTEIEVVSYKPEAVKAFEKIEKVEEQRLLGQIRGGGRGNGNGKLVQFLSICRAV